jgi:auxin influx carrier (AUX1 LAX family)
VCNTCRPRVKLPSCCLPHGCSELQVIWGAVLQLFAFFPSFKHFRILNIAALVGTTMTAM